jgi:hypothetical protein
MGFNSGFKGLTYRRHRYVRVINSSIPSFTKPQIIVALQAAKFEAIELVQHFLNQTSNCIHFSPYVPIDIHSAIHPHTVSFILAAVRPAVHPHTVSFFLAAVRPAVHPRTVSFILAAVRPAVYNSSNFIQSRTHPSFHTVTSFHISVDMYPNLFTHYS